MSWDKLFPSGLAMNDRKVFFQEFFPKWSGFYINDFDSELQLVEALHTLDRLVEGVSMVWTSNNGYVESNMVDRNKLKLWEVCIFYSFNQ